MAWSFDGTSFAVVQDGPFVEEWLPRVTESTTYRVLGGTTRYTNIGATGYDGELTVVAQFTLKATRDALLVKEGTSGTLTDDDGRSCVALLKSVQEGRVVKKDSGLYRLACMFVYVGAS